MRTRTSAKLVPLDKSRLPIETLANANPIIQAAEDLMGRFRRIDHAIIVKDHLGLAQVVESIRADAVQLHQAFVILGIGLVHQKLPIGKYMPMMAVLAADLRIPEMLHILFRLRDLPLDSLMQLLDGDMLDDAERCAAAIAADYPEELDTLREVPSGPGAVALGVTVELRLARAGIIPLAPAIDHARGALQDYLGANIPHKSLGDASLALANLVRAVKRYAPNELGSTLDTLRKDRVAGEMMHQLTRIDDLFDSAKVTLDEDDDGTIGVDAIAVFNAWIDYADKPASDQLRALTELLGLSPDGTFARPSGHSANHFSGIPFIRATPKVGPNDPCPCGSGKKYKKCCRQ